MRILLNSILRHVACGEIMAPEAFNEQMQSVRTSKHKAAEEGHAAVRGQREKVAGQPRPTSSLPKAGLWICRSPKASLERAKSPRVPQTHSLDGGHSYAKPGGSRAGDRTTG